MAVLRKRHRNMRELLWRDSSAFRGADLSHMSLVAAYLDHCNLVDVNFSGSNLRGANLTGSDLSGANFTNTQLHGVSFRNARLYGTDLAVADLSKIRKDLFRVLRVTNEAAAVLDAVRNGRVDGTVYTGECACLLGTIGAAKGYFKQGYHHSFNELRNDESHIERWFIAFKPGDKPQTSQIARITEGWLVEWIDSRSKSKEKASARAS